jgi:hypothetical protein
LVYGEGLVPAEPARLQLPTDWRIGSQHRYRATWIRDWGKGMPEVEKDSEAKGEVAVTVAEKTALGYLLRWQPTLVPAERPASAPGDFAAAGVTLWLEALGMPLDLTFVPKTQSLTVSNAAPVRDRLSGRVRQLVRQAGIAADCEAPDAPSVCALYSTEASASAFALHYAAPLFDCSGLELDARAPESWTKPVPDPQLAGVALRYRREVLAFEAGSPQVRIRTVVEPDEEEWRAFVRREAARIGGPEQLQQGIAELRYRVETVCTMDRVSGWPLLVERRSLMGSSLVEGEETVRFERLPLER